MIINIIYISRLFIVAYIGINIFLISNPALAAPEATKTVSAETTIRANIVQHSCNLTVPAQVSIGLIVQSDGIRAHNESIFDMEISCPSPSWTGVYGEVVSPTQLSPGVIDIVRMSNNSTQLWLETKNSTDNRQGKVILNGQGATQDRFLVCVGNNSRVCQLVPWTNTRKDTSTPLGKETATIRLVARSF